MKDIKFPKPSPDLKAYNETIDRGFKMFPRRYQNYLIYKDFARSPKVSHMPIKLDIENVNRCNLKCEMCQVSTFKNQKRSDDLSLGDFKNILDKQYGVFEIKIQGIGEPFLHEDFIKMVEYASSKSIWVRSTTNATLLHKKENYKKIIDANIGELQISVDGVTKETYEKIRKNGSFQKVVENCKLINDYCGSIGTNKTRMWVLLQQDNFHELNTFPEFAKELGFKRLTISMDVNGWGSKEWTYKNEQRRVNDKIIQNNINELLIKATKFSIDLSFWDIATKYSKENPCPWPFERSYISSDKKVVPCCMIGNPEIYNFGELGEFEDIWNSQRYIQFREAHLSGKVPSVCKYCYR